MGAERRQAPGPHRDPPIAGLTPGAHHKQNKQSASARRCLSIFVEPGAVRRRVPTATHPSPGAHHKLNLRIRVSGARQRADVYRFLWSRAPSGAGSPPRSTHRRADARRSPQAQSANPGERRASARRWANPPAAGRRQAPGPHRDPPIAGLTPGAHHKLNRRIRVSGARQRADVYRFLWSRAPSGAGSPPRSTHRRRSPQAQSANPGERRASARRWKSMGAERRQAPGPHRDPSIAGLTTSSICESG
jgi:hypothetical protein